MSRMKATPPSTDATSDQRVALRLNVDLFDRLMARLGATSPQERAALLGIDRATYYRWRGGKTPDLGTAMRVANQLGTRVDKLWQRESE